MLKINNLSGVRGSGLQASGPARTLEPDPWTGIDTGGHLKAAAVARVCALMAQVLGKEMNEVGLDDDFEASLGGDSIKRTTLHFMLEVHFKVRITETAMQGFRTVRQIATWVCRNGSL